MIEAELALGMDFPLFKLWSPDGIMILFMRLNYIWYSWFNEWKFSPTWLLSQDWFMLKLSFVLTGFAFG